MPKITNIFYIVNIGSRDTYENADQTLFTRLSQGTLFSVPRR